ncbi:3-oxoacyl-ACP synthase III family protein [Streptomyces sp. NEAU-Y11]|uniref:3-oxoacyl-ACP synthase III family protein n=1 Tax=Streptomyces cucumeris TaxID=2962890 RepID=UPI0020C83C30|nr:3-oxoacyl-[acyl-carrier-protein] synthase III C-terminal domain-containing protein [Streptomyces sp. NEAU-Y11]MCP9210897.1 3-oxoacyl-ACP synthase [Streptomyces sp. NEAU-Y11]
MPVLTPSIGIAGTGNYLPNTPISLESYVEAGLELSPMDNGPLLRAPQWRHHVAPGDRAAEMIERAAVPMFERLGVDPAREVDVLVTNVLLPDDLFTGCGADTAHRMGMSPEWIIDLHNGGCASFQYMLKVVAAIMASEGARTALIANVQNTAGQIFAQDGNRFKSHSVAAGDGCGVALVTADPGPGTPLLLGTRVRHSPATARDLGMATPDGRHHWQTGDSVLDVRFDAAKTKETLELGNRLVPELVRELGERCAFGVDEIDVLITNQPNRVFLRNWRNALGIDAERHVDTYDRFGNLYGAGVPVTLHEAVSDGRVKPGDLVVTAGFAHAGDFAAAAAFRW